MKRIDRVISGFLKSQAISFDAALDIFIKDFITDIKRLIHYRVLRLGKTVNMKYGLLKIQTEYAENFIEHYEKTMSENIGLYSELSKEWNQPKDIKALMLLVKRMEIFKKELDTAFNSISKTAIQLTDNLVFIQTKYVLTQKENQK
ncbi:MAG: hypothetical protein NTX92_09270, partial [Euryarchaeota archaeon]|nr:hypothetical protein [Euryarchaeota archaeon]